MADLIAKEGVFISDDLSSDLSSLLGNANLSGAQSLFLQQQIKAANCKKKCGMRWHPALIRLGLKIHLKSPAAYRALQESGFDKLPTSRTLFDYSHASKIEYGVDSSVVKKFSKRVEEEKKEKKHPQFHVLIADEIHISKNLVIQKSTGELIGFKDLDSVDKEIAQLDLFLEDDDKQYEPEIASKILSFMVKGCSSKLKDVVASFPVCSPSPKQLYAWTWEVIGALEKSGIKVIVFTCDGASTNRAFIKLHQPVTTDFPGLIFDTVNKYAPERILYFMSDVPHLLKTTRNGLYNSRLKGKGARCLQKNKEPMVWDTIINLYLMNKDRNIRKSFKLSPQNVFPDSFSKMKVALAAQVLSRTVANDIAGQGWPKTSEIVEFIRKTTDWFDLLNGAFSTQGQKKNNPRLNAYTLRDLQDFENNVEGNRFQELLDYLKYHNEWQEEVRKLKEIQSTSLMSELGVQPLEAIDDGSFHALAESMVEDCEKEDFSKHLLPKQTILGINMSTQSFIKAVTFLLSNGAPFVNARTFCQDILEQNFGKQRMAGGGSSNPNVAQYFQRQRGISIVGQLGSSKKRGFNTEVLDEEADLNDKPLPKRQFKRDLM
ncbi:Transposable element P transposase [Frankliniella fusca]|uniref:Transposable element P transposase n=1 Tax=Frankliniella fusca TaxID=407009 RepID=A0AAE1HR80_9NEOP|nr:Transposable element P transposase [Frankliniella fusca]